MEILQYQQAIFILSFFFTLLLVQKEISTQWWVLNAVSFFPFKKNSMFPCQLQKPPLSNELQMFSRCSLQCAVQAETCFQCLD